MEWKVFRYDSNEKEIRLFNIFDHGGFRNDFCKLAKKCKDKERFAEELRYCLMYYFWCKCEHEVLIFPWPCNPERDNPRKGDVFWQINCNWAAFVDYVWEHRKEVKSEL